jgi:hypothetical protein
LLERETSSNGDREVGGLPSGRFALTYSLGTSPLSFKIKSEENVQDQANFVTNEK